MTKDDREAYDKFFKDWDIDHMGFLEEDTAVEVMRRSGLSNEDLEKLWTLSNPGNKRTLDMDEFAVAIHLIHRKLSGYPVPNQLPPEIVSPPTRNVELPPEIVSLPTRNIAKPIVTVKSLLSQDAETRENSSAFLQPQQSRVSYLKRNPLSPDFNSVPNQLPSEIVSPPTKNVAKPIVTVKSLLPQHAETRENLSAFYHV